MVGLPRLHGELGAKRVEVTAWQDGQFGNVRVSLKTWPATTRKVHSSMDESLSANLSGSALLQGRAAGVGQPFTERQRSEVRGRPLASVLISSSCGSSL